MKQLIGFIQTNQKWCFGLVLTLAVIGLVFWNISLTKSYDRKLNDIQAEVHVINMYIRDSPWLECEKKR
jgi:hypothetical protein